MSSESLLPFMNVVTNVFDEKSLLICLSQNEWFILFIFSVIDRQDKQRTRHVQKSNETHNK